VSVVDRDETPELAEFDEVEIKPEPSTPGGTASEVGDEDEEMRIKDFKPSVDVTFKGKPTLLHVPFIDIDI
jgi:hypothetical protein